MTKVYNITLPIPPSVNAAYGQGRGQQRFKSKSYKGWLNECPKLPELNIDYPVSLSYTMHFKTTHERDIANFEKLATDYLVSQGVLSDDNWRIVQEVNIKLGSFDKDNPRLEVDISEL